MILIGVALLVGGAAWLAEHPEHDPRAPLDLNDPVGWATATKLANLRGDTQLCRAVLRRSNVAIAALEPTGEGACARPDRTVLEEYPFTPGRPSSTCDVALALELWQRNTLNRIAENLFEANVSQVRHVGTYSCRRLYGRGTGDWSEHATGNAIDIVGFTLSDGTDISVLGDWDGGGRKSVFLRQARDGACEVFSTTLSPDYNSAHADHLHLDMARRWSGVCR